LDELLLYILEFPKFFRILSFLGRKEDNKWSFIRNIT
jgi:hypothetical protein